MRAVHAGCTRCLADPDDRFAARAGYTVQIMTGPGAFNSRNARWLHINHPPDACPDIVDRLLCRYSQLRALLLDRLTEILQREISACAPVLKLHRSAGARDFLQLPHKAVILRIKRTVSRPADRHVIISSFQFRFLLNRFP
ncbi:hypothetical protein D3C80_1435070 [compost metagenome]